MDQTTLVTRVWSSLSIQIYYTYSIACKLKLVAKASDSFYSDEDSNFVAVEIILRYQFVRGPEPRDPNPWAL